MAYLKNCKRACDRSGCTSTASQSLYNMRNAHMGDYCGKHAAAALKALQEREDRNG